MRLRRQHAWGAALIALFALPVLTPEGIPVLERPIGSFFAWFGRVPALNPRLWAPEAREGEDADGPRARALAVENALLREQFADRLQVQDDMRDALAALGAAGLDRLPRALPARVLRAADAAGWRQSILIDQGEQDGVVPGLAVISGSVFVGQVEVVQGRSALVKLLTDRQSRVEVAVRTDASVRLVGYVRGDGTPPGAGDLRIRHVQAQGDVGRVLPGAAVVTSNADARVPAGLLVGWVTAVDDRALGGEPLLEMTPALDLARTTRVFVLLPPAGVLPAR